MGKDNKSEAIAVLQEYRKLIWPEVQNYLDSPSFPLAFKIGKKYKSEESFHWKLTRDYPERKSKYVRPTLVVLTAAAMGVEVNKALKTAAAMQLSEEWILVHDDIEDDSELRRGKPTLHNLYGIGLAINAGDSLHASCWKALFDNLPTIGPKKTSQLVEEFYSILIRTAIGQTVEINWVRENNLDFSDEDWYFIADSKVAYYTIAGPIRLGAILAGANNAQMGALTEFGLHLGRCFQLVDDVLDITSDFGGLKKKGNDIYEGKRSVILGHLLRSANKKDRDVLVSILRKHGYKKTAKDVDWVINKMQEYKSIDYARGLARLHKEKAKNVFNAKLGFLSKQPERDRINSLINFILERKY